MTHREQIDCSWEDYRVEELRGKKKRPVDMDNSVVIEVSREVGIGLRRY